MTEYGMKIKNVLMAMQDWGLEHLQHLKELDRFPEQK
jgi:DNA-binding HxlR family transcriptional regulator